jgi:hypothetical protein
MVRTACPRTIPLGPAGASMGVMSTDENLKKQLPHPYDQDLSKVLTHLNRRSPFTRARLANDPVTAAYMAAAVRLVSHHLGPNPERVPIDPQDPNSLPRPLLSFISMPAVVAELANNPDPLPRQGSLGAMRSTWHTHSDFIADLVSLVTWSGGQPPEFYEEMAAGAERLIEGPDAVDAVHDLAYLNMADATTSPSFRLGLIAMTAAEGDKTVSDAVTQSYQELLQPWKEVYAAFIEARGLQLRPGITIDDIANILAALVDGLALRLFGNPADEMVDHGKKRTLLGTAALAVAYSFMEPAKDARGLTLEQAVHEMIYGQPEPGQPAD